MLKASVIICSHLPERIDFLKEAVDSIVNQTYKAEIVVIVDGSTELYYKILNDRIYNRIDQLLLNPKNIGLSLSRNRGAEAAKGNILIFFDDDAFANSDWVSELMCMYTEYNAIAAAGKTNPDWMEDKKEYIPEEYLWLIGASHKGLPEKIKEVPNGFGSNISFIRDVFIDLGGFKPDFGFNNNKVLQGEELELCLRMKEKYGKGVMYNPDAIIKHKVFGNRAKVRTLIRRAFWQGYSKRQIKENNKVQLTTENAFLKNVFFDAIPNKVTQLILLFMLTMSVGLGYCYRMIRK